MFKRLFQTKKIYFIYSILFCSSETYVQSVIFIPNQIYVCLNSMQTCCITVCLFSYSLCLLFKTLPFSHCHYFLLPYRDKEPRESHKSQRSVTLCTGPINLPSFAIPTFIIMLQNKGENNDGGQFYLGQQERLIQHYIL